MLKQALETAIGRLMNYVALAPNGWRLQLRWWEHIHHQRHRQIRAKFIQDNCDGMTEEQWYAWFDTLNVNEFIHVMLLPDPDDAEAELVQEIVDALTTKTEE